MQGYGCFAGTRYSLNDECSGFFITDNPVLLSLDGGNDVLHLIICIRTQFFLQNIIVYGQRTFNHEFHPSSPDSVLTFQGNIPFYLSRWGLIRCFAQFVIVEHARNRRPPIINHGCPAFSIMKGMDTYINRDYRTVLTLLLKVYSSEIGNIHHSGKPLAFVNYTFTYGKMIQNTFTHRADLMRIDIFITPKVVFVLRQYIYMIFYRHIGVADYLLQPIDYLM